MVSASVLKLGGSDVQDSFPCALRDQMDEAKKILAGITESHAASGSGFVVGSGAGHVKGNHTLVLVPDICHTVYMRILALYVIAGEKLIPVCIQLGKGGIHLLGSGEFLHNLLSRILLDHIWCFPFVIFGILAVAKKEHKFFLLARCQGNVDLLAGNWVPSAGNGVAALSFLHSNRIIVSAAKSQEIITAGIKAIHRGIYCEKAVVVAALSVLGLMVNGAADDLHLTSA
ncbi:Uncharacterised protein [uncultured Blautia sp.]|nr:Uncharacterised protein [uncultured Blautia sp.]